MREKLRNTEDKLGAAEQCKTLLNDEVTAVQQAHQKMSQDLEVCVQRLVLLLLQKDYVRQHM